MEADFTAKTKRIDVLPLVKYYLSELDFYPIFQKYIPKQSNAEMEPAQALCMMVLNIICARRPLYKVEEWLADYTDGLSEKVINASQYNDDQPGQSMDKLFAADRHGIMSELSSNAIKVHELQTDDMHNDSTSVTFSGEYETQEQGSVNLTRGFNKDHRPDCKQVVFGLNITADGNVPSSPGRPGPKTIYTEKIVSSFRLEYALNAQTVSKAARTDGIFPLITNSTIEASEVLKKYKNQPYLEKRMYTAKSVLKVAPVFLKSPRRIEAMLFLYFAALMIVGLVERNIRKKYEPEKY